MPYVDLSANVETWWEDISQNRAVASFCLVSSVPRSVAEVCATELVGHMEAASDAQVQELRIIYRSNRVPFTPPTSGNLVVPHACLFFESASGKEAVLSIPAAKDAIYQGDGITVDATNPDVAAIISAVINGLSGVSPITYPDWEDITTYVGGYKQERCS